jgi:hypothetical protein
MASIGPGRYVVVVLHVGGIKMFDVKLVLQRGPRTGKTWFPARSVTANEEHVDVAVRDPDGSYVVPETLDIGGPNLTPAKTGLLPAMKHKSELLHFGYVTQWETFRRAVYTSHALLYDDTTIPKQFFM